MTSPGAKAQCTVAEQLWVQFAEVLTTWAFLDKLRDRKNEIFEACTDRTRELIDR
jgi:hypothetical protein